MNSTAELYQRRQDLAAAVTQAFPQRNGVIILIGGFELGRHCFRQESTFYYFSGIEEPGAIMVIDLHGRTRLFIPATKVDRAQWLEGALTPDAKHAQAYGFDAIAYLGQPQPGYTASPLAPRAAYEHIISQLSEVPEVFTCAPASTSQYLEQKIVLERLQTYAPKTFSNVQDIAALVARMRRKKSRAEIELMYKAVEVTMLAQEAAGQSMQDGAEESHVQASLEFIFTEHGARPAFPSIVASGKQSTILHYCRNNKIMRQGDVVVVDIGAELDYYCADLTRTYPVSGTFTQRQREVYTIVLETQQHIAALAKPGVWLNNPEKPEQSLQHRAQAFLEQRGYAHFFKHGIGHFLGLDVHDVGNVLEPLQEGDVITIEPGIYIPDEKIGIRIEDNYWIVKDGAECLSEALPKSVDEIEALAKASLYDGEDEETSLEDEFEA